MWGWGIMKEDRKKIIEQLMEEELWRLKKDNNKIQVRKDKQC